jgi:glycine hydroxymethyltransferase
MNPSGIRMGTPIVTTRGMKEKDMEKIAGWIDRVITLVTPHCSLKSKEFSAMLPQIDGLKEIAGEVKELCLQYPLDMG